MEMIVLTPEQIKNRIRAAKDSVWVIESTINKIENGEVPSVSLRDMIECNVNHLKNIVANAEIINSGEDISELENGITLGDAKLAENIWTTE